MQRFPQPLSLPALAGEGKRPRKALSTQLETTAMPMQQKDAQTPDDENVAYAGGNIAGKGPCAPVQVRTGGLFRPDDGMADNNRYSQFPTPVTVKR